MRLLYSILARIKKKTFSKMDIIFFLKQRFGLENDIRDVRNRVHRIVPSKI